MENKYSMIKRIFRRAVEELYSTYLVSKNTSMLYFPMIFKAKLLNYYLNKSGKAENSKNIECLIRKHDILKEYFEKRYGNFVKNYRFDEKSIPEKTEYMNKIWVCWWQGLSNAPDIVQKCVSSIIDQASPYEVIVLDDTNYVKYIRVPDWMENKRKQGIISRTHFSDYLRVELLAEHGGIWLDATFFAKNFDATKIFELPVWSIKRPGYGHLSVACGNFANYSLGCNFENRKAFAIIRDYLLEYWKTNNCLIDYLFLDYLIDMAVRHNNYLKTMFDSIPRNNPLCDELQKVLDKEYNCDVWNRIIEDTNLFKLSWKREYPMLINDKDTFYGMLHKNKL